MQIETFSEVIKKIRELPKGAALAIADHSKFIYYQPGESIDIPITPGEVIKEGTVTLRTIQIKQTISTEVDERLFGKPYFATGYPILNNGNLEGVVTAILPPKLKNLGQSKPHFLIGKQEDVWVPVNLKDIYFITAEEGKTMLYTKLGKFQNKFNLNELEFTLPQDKFIRCHRSFIVQLQSIVEIQPNFHSTFLLVMNDDKRTRIPVSQSFASQFRNLLGF